MNFELKTDKRTGSYYLDYYIKSSLQSYYSEEELEFTKRLYKYKDYVGLINRDIWADFTIELMRGIAQIDEKAFWRFREIHLVAVPRSHPKKYSPMADSIKMIARLSKDGASGCKRPLIDKSDLIIRSKPIRESHKSGYYGAKRPDIPAHMASMSLTSEVSKNGVLYIIMDDIVTSGNSLWACANLLMVDGVPRDNIRFLAIGRTL